jgi:FixJ family two-component response regulator
LTAAKQARRQTRPKSVLRGSKAAGTAQPSTVLILDDDVSVLRSLSRLVSLAGFQVKTFDRPSALLASEIPKRDVCMVVDISMPEMNGVELCEALAKSGHRLPAILITGRSEAEVQPLIEKAGAIEVLYKPVDEEPLLRAIARAIALSRQSAPGNS